MGGRGGAPAVAYLALGPPGPAAAEFDSAALLDALGAHAPTVEPDPPAGCWLALRPGRRGPAPAAAAGAILATAGDWGCPAPRVGVAPTPGVARLAAWHGGENPTVLGPAAVAPFLAALPVAALGLGAGPTDRLALVGLRTVGALAALPRGALGDYLGAEGPAVEALARGEDDRPLVPARPPLELTARRDLDHPLAERGRLADLRRRGLGATRAALALRDARGRRLGATVRLAAPATTPEAIVGPLLAALPDPDPGEGGGEEGGAGDEAGGIVAVAVTLAVPRPVAGRQLTFFDVPQGRQARLAAGLAEARRRADGPLGYLRPADPAHPLPERRHRLDEGAGPPAPPEAAP